MLLQICIISLDAAKKITLPKWFKHLKIYKYILNIKILKLHKTLIILNINIFSNVYNLMTYICVYEFTYFIMEENISIALKTVCLINCSIVMANIL